MVVVVNESFKLSSCDDDEEHEEQVRDLFVANEEAIERSAGIDDHVERLGKDNRYPKRERTT